MTPRALAIAACCLAGAALAPDQSAPAPPQTTFRAGVDIVDVDVSVLDRHRLPIRGLSAADFTVLEDGKPRPIVAFSSVDLPTRVRPTAPWLDDIAPDDQLMIPMRVGNRSINLANAVSIVLYEAWRQHDFAGSAPGTFDEARSVLPPHGNST